SREERHEPWRAARFVPAVLPPPPRVRLAPRRLDVAALGAVPGAAGGHRGAVRRPQADPGEVPARGGVRIPDRARHDAPGLTAVAPRHPRLAGRARGRDGDRPDVRPEPDGEG